MMWQVMATPHCSGDRDSERGRREVRAFVWHGIFDHVRVGATERFIVSSSHFHPRSIGIPVTRISPHAACEPGSYSNTKTTASEPGTHVPSLPYSRFVQGNLLINLDSVWCTPTQFCGLYSKQIPSFKSTSRYTSILPVHVLCLVCSSQGPHVATLFPTQAFTSLCARAIFPIKFKLPGPLTAFPPTRIPACLRPSHRQRYSCHMDKMSAPHL